MVQVPFWTTASQGRKESKPREGSALPVQMEAVAGQVEVSTQAGWECPDTGVGVCQGGAVRLWAG